MKKYIKSDSDAKAYWDGYNNHKVTITEIHHTDGTSVLYMTNDWKPGTSASCLRGTVIPVKTDGEYEYGIVGENRPKGNSPYRFSSGYTGYCIDTATGLIWCTKWCKQTKATAMYWLRDSIRNNNFCYGGKLQYADEYDSV